MLQCSDIRHYPCFFDSYVDAYSKAEEIEPASVAKDELKSWLGYEKAVGLLGPNLEGPVLELLVKLAHDFFDNRCEWCEGTGMNNAHERIIFWENEIAKRFSKSRVTADKLALAKIASNKLMPIELCGICGGSGLNTVPVSNVLGGKNRGHSSASKKAKAMEDATMEG